MITKMKKYTFMVFYKDFDKFLSAIRQKGVIHINKKAPNNETKDLIQKYTTEKNERIRLIKQGASDELIRKTQSLNEQIRQITIDINRINVWGDFNPKTLDLLKNYGYELHFFSCSKSTFNTDWGIVINETKDKIYFASLLLPSQLQACNQHELTNQSPLQLRETLLKLNNEKKQLEEDINNWQQTEMIVLKKELARLQQNIEWQNVEASTQKTADNNICILEGFCPANESDSLNNYLAMDNSLALYYQCEEPKEGDTPPIKLKNNSFISLFESLTSMYGLPDYHEFDPTPILGPFFLLFFALCIGDAGYGLLLVLIGYLIYKNKLKIEMFEGLGPIIMVLGGGSAVIGYLMGGFFGLDLYSASWFPDSLKFPMFKNLGINGKIGEYDVMMVLALVVGIIHICIALTVKAISYTQNQGFKATVPTWSWLLLIIGSILTGTLYLFSTMKPQSISALFISIGAISALGIFIFNKPGRNPLINIGAGLWDTYGTVTGMLGDVLSYIRLYALGLAGGMLGAAFNDLGLMVLGDSPNAFTAIGFFLIVTFGHILNLLMACLGAFVHPLRLTFVEYFKNSGYIGSGKKYQPFKI